MLLSFADKKPTCHEFGAVRGGKSIRLSLSIIYGNLAAEDKCYYYNIDK